MHKQWSKIGREQQKSHPQKNQHRADARAFSMYQGTRPSPNLFPALQIILAHHQAHPFHALTLTSLPRTNHPQVVLLCVPRPAPPDHPHDLPTPPHPR